VDRLVRPLVACRDEIRLDVEELGHLLRVMIPQRQRDRLTFRRRVELRFERVREQLLHLRVAAIACDLDWIVIHPEIQRVVIVLEQETNNVDAVLAHGEVERLAIVVVRPRQRRIVLDQRLYCFGFPRYAGLEKLPQVASAPGRPQELLVRFQLGGLQHAV
jgi:hypothetical protein